MKKNCLSYVTITEQLTSQIFWYEVKTCVYSWQFIYSPHGHEYHGNIGLRVIYLNCSVSGEE